MANAPGIDPNGVGRLVGAGLQHRIYEYETDGSRMVLKVVNPNRMLRFPTAAEAREDLELVSRFFGPFALVPAEVVPLKDGTYAIKQRRLSRFRGVTRADLDGEVKAEILEIVRRNREMMKAAGRSLDFLGREGQRKSRAALLGFSSTPTISNLVIEPQPDGREQLRILDTDLENFRPGARSLRDLRSALAARLAFQVNRLLIKRFFGVDIE